MSDGSYEDVHVAEELDDGEHIVRQGQLEAQLTAFVAPHRQNATEAADYQSSGGEESEVAHTPSTEDDMPSQDSEDGLADLMRPARATKTFETSDEKRQPKAASSGAKRFVPEPSRKANDATTERASPKENVQVSSQRHRVISGNGGDT